MAHPLVVHVRRDPYDVYIGRAVPRARLAASPWGNPFRPGEGTSNRDAIAQFRLWVEESDEPRARWIRQNVHTLRGKRLACWCAPEPCHGEVLAAMAEAAAATAD